MTPELTRAVADARAVLDKLWCPFAGPVRDRDEARRLMQAMADRGPEMLVEFERLQQAIQGAK